MARIAAKTTLAVALLLALLQLTWWFGLQRYAADLARAVAPVARLDYGAVRTWPVTAPGLEQVRFVVAGRPELVLSADALNLSGADPIWLLRWLLGLRPPVPERLTVHVQGLQPSGELLRQLRRQTGVAGLVLPFEGVGCGETAHLQDEDYAILGWQPLRFDLELQLRPDRDRRRLEVGLRIDRTPAGVAQIEVELAQVPDRGVALAADLGGARLDRMELRVAELGSLALRNEHCAARQGLDRAAFIDLHMQRLHQHLSGRGVVPDEPVWAAYREWLGSGGEFTLLARPAPGVPFGEYRDFAPEDRLRLLGLSVRRGDGEPVPVEATTAPRTAGVFRPLPPPEQLLPLVEPPPQDEWAALEDPVLANAAGADPGAATAAGTLPARVRATTPVQRLQRIDFADLHGQVGNLVRVRMLNGNRHTGRVLGATADAVELEIRRYGGSARLPISRSQIGRLEITVTVPAAPGG